jgi:hypothetical protein
MPWTKGNLEQQWKIKSERGQISIQCLAKPNMYSVSSFKLDLVAKSRVDVPIEFSEDSKIVLDSVFHPGGASQPLQPWFEVTVQGPGPLHSLSRHPGVVGQSVFAQAACTRKDPGTVGA